MIESPKKLSPAARWSLVIGLWVVLSALFYFGMCNVAWVTTWAHGILFGCLLVFGLVVAFSLVAAAIHLSVDTIRGRYPYPQERSDAAPRIRRQKAVVSQTTPQSAIRNPQSRKSRLRVTMRTLAVLVVTMVMTLVLLEIGLRHFAPQFSPEMRAELTKGIFTSDPATTYRTMSGLNKEFHIAESDTMLVINSQGLREDHEVAPPPSFAGSGPAPQSGTTRVLCVGDSFTFGYGVEGNQAYPYLLNGSKAPDNSAIESINGGVMGYGTDNEAAWLQAYGWQLKPKIVIVGFYVGNDVRDVILGREKTMVDEQGNLLPSSNEPANSVKYWLAANSHAYVFLRGLAHDIFAPKTKGDTQGFKTYDTASLYFKTEPSDIAGGWGKALGLLDSMRADATAHGAEFVVVVIPTREQVDDAFWQQMLNKFRLNEADLQRDRPQQRLADWSASSGTPIIDLLPGFRADAGSDPYYYTLDSHWNPAGHTLAAKLIRDGMAKLGLFSP